MTTNNTDYKRPETEILPWDFVSDLLASSFDAGNIEGFDEVDQEW